MYRFFLIISFRQEKASLVSELKKLVEKHHEKKSAIQKNSDFLSVIKLGLLSLSTKLDTLHSFNTLYSCMMDSSSTSQVDIDALDILKKVQQKLHILEYRIKSKNFTMTPALYLTGKKLFEEAIIQQNIVEHKEDEYDLAITMMMEEFTATNDSLVPTRADIKKQSYNLVKETHVEAADEYDLKLEPSSWEQIRTHRQKQ
ncbi:uncharacterized protein LOC142329339 [Lycorma delicatula]|uniref:uncharacterized protein LOC142329339 n=1 Tax=Lycorma delicatula TaxID=130591 RepID=UPI003F50E754